MSLPGRRAFLGACGAGAGLMLAGCASEILPKTSRRVVVVGGGFGGAVAAKYVRLLDPGIEVILIERHRQYVACPFSNHVITGRRELSTLALNYDALAARYGIRLLFAEATAIDPDGQTIHTTAGKLRYDRLILSPGIDFRVEEIAGYDPATTPELLPHAWHAGSQTLLLKRQIDAMPDNGSVLISIPLAPYRCPGAPYERACLIAAYLQRHKPRARIVMLDANPEIVALGAQFRRAWTTRYPGMIDYQPAMRVTEVDAKSRTLRVESMLDFRADVVNLIPPQRAGKLALAAGLTDSNRHWCPVEATTFESTRHGNIHVIGDAALAGAMPKSGYAANSQAKICAINTVALINGKPPHALAGLNVCYAAIGEEEDVSIAQVFQVTDGKIVAVANTATTSPVDLSTARIEHRYAESWLNNILAEMSA